jgi:hypothetical protein
LSEEALKDDRESLYIQFQLFSLQMDRSRQMDRRGVIDIYKESRRDVVGNMEHRTGDRAKRNRGGFTISESVFQRIGHLFFFPLKDDNNISWSHGKERADHQTSVCGKSGSDVRHNTRVCNELLRGSSCCHICLGLW